MSSSKGGTPHPATAAALAHCSRTRRRPHHPHHIDIQTAMQSRASDTAARLQVAAAAESRTVRHRFVSGAGQGACRTTQTTLISFMRAVTTMDSNGISGYRRRTTEHTSLTHCNGHDLSFMSSLVAIRVRRLTPSRFRLGQSPIADITYDPWPRSQQSTRDVSISSQSWR